MGTLTYSALLITLFIIGAFVFGYFENYITTLKKGLDKSIDRGVKNLRNIKVLNLNRKSNKTLTVGLSKSDANKSNSTDDLRIYVHEY